MSEILTSSNIKKENNFKNIQSIFLNILMNFLNFIIWTFFYKNIFGLILKILSILIDYYFE